MNILQISAPKSGSYWLYTILLNILEKKGIKRRSFIQNTSCFQQAKHLKLSFKGQAGVDMVDIEEEGCFYRISSAFRKKIPDLEHYAGATNLAWTHSSFCTTSAKIFPLFDKKICIVRDPRDRALSAAKFAFTPYMKEFYPSSYSSSEEYFMEEYERLLDQWSWFIGNYLLQKQAHDIHFIFYEKLLFDFENELRSLLAYLEVSLSSAEQEEISSAVTFYKMKDKSPGHLQKGQAGKWVQQLTKFQKETALEKTGDLLQILRYPIETAPGENHLPFLPVKFSQKSLREQLQKMQWHSLFI